MPEHDLDNAPRPLVDVFDWDLDRTTMPVLLERLRQPSATPRLVVTVNAATLWMASVNPALARVIQDASLRVADGMGVLWSWRVLGRRLPERIAGIDLMVGLVAAAAEDGRSIYLLGARDEVVSHLVDVLTTQHPGLRIAGARDGYFSEPEHTAVIDTIRASDADLLFIGMPSPFKELWAAEHLTEFGADLVLGVGGSFDVLAGFVPRAPAFMQRSGMEWAWRLACEPRRMWKRYAVTNAWLARRVVAGWFRRR
ncbi:MAG: WecB/TagA/CpsF family glycosyltransferase [Acidimicrobiales bacterium]